MTTTVLMQAIEFLRRDPLYNIVPLKMLTAYPQAIDIHYAQNDVGTGLLLLFPTTAFAYDRQSYPHDDWIALIATTTPDMVDQLLPLLPKQQRIVFKLNAGALPSSLAQKLPLTRLTAFHSYTSTVAQAFREDHSVVEGRELHHQLYPLLAAHGHERQDLDPLLTSEETRTYTLFQHQRPLAACFTYQNFENIHEIGGVITVPEERRKGYAKQVVETAIAALHRRAYRPRYQVHEANIPSIRLAEQIGLTCFTIVEHWRYQP